MEFYSTSKNVVIWDPKKNKALCVFKNGILKTDDKQLCDTLISLGYKYNSDDVIDGNLDKLTLTELKNIAKEKGLIGISKKKREDLIQLLREKEGENEHTKTDANSGK